MRIITLFILFFPVSVLAYPVGVSLGWGSGYSWTQSKFDEPINTDLGQVKVPSYTSVKNQDLPWSMYAGFRFHQHYGIEMGYLDYGSIKFTKTITSATQDGVPTGNVIRNARISTQGLYISHVLFFQVFEKLQLQMKAGIIFGDNQYAETGQVTIVDENNNAITDPEDFNSYNESFAKGQLAMGLLYHYKPEWRLRLQVNQIEFDHPSEKESFNQWFTSFSIERKL